MEVKASRRRNSPKHAAIFSAIDERTEPISTRELVDLVGLTVCNVLLHVKALHDDRRIYVAKYRLSTNGRWVPLYLTGDRRDARKPGVFVQGEPDDRPQYRTRRRRIRGEVDGVPVLTEAEEAAAFALTMLGTLGYTMTAVAQLAADTVE